MTSSSYSRAPVPSWIELDVALDCIVITTSRRNTVACYAVPDWHAVLIALSDDWDHVWLRWNALRDSLARELALLDKEEGAMEDKASGDPAGVQDLRRGNNVCRDRGGLPHAAGRQRTLVRNAMGGHPMSRIRFSEKELRFGYVVICTDEPSAEGIYKRSVKPVGSGWQATSTGWKTTLS